MSETDEDRSLWRDYEEIFREWADSEDRVLRTLANVVRDRRGGE